jgi:hypothetical protein
MSKNDTVSILVGRIGIGNLTGNAKKKIKILNEKNENLVHLETALEEADDTGKSVYEKDVKEAKEYIVQFEADLLEFLKQEEADLIEKRRLAKEKQDAVEAEKAQIAAAKKIDDDKTAKAASEAAAATAAEEAAAQTLLDTEAKKKAEAEAAAKVAAEANNPPAPTDEKKSSGLGAVLVTGVLVVFTAGLYLWNKNKQ